MSERLTTDELARAAGVTRRQLDHWARTGLIKPAEPASGPGTPLRWAASTVAVARILGRLRPLYDGEQLAATREALVDHIEEHGPVGTVELVPGITLDLDVLKREPDSLGTFV